MVKPKSRQEGLLTEQIGDELVVYDQQRKRASRLNKTVALVWRQCDGTKSVSDIVSNLQKELNEAADENLVLLSLAQLESAHLMDESVKLSSQQTRNSRREFLRKVGSVGVMSMLLPLITTMAVPTPAQAQSPTWATCGCNCGCTCPCIFCACGCSGTFCVSCTGCVLCSTCSGPSCAGR